MDDEEEDYIAYGTPLPDIEDEYVLRKKAARELEVRDEKGRQRFHGAFTGGFSAGYFNTVGTKEGWAPSTFVSSQGKTAERIQQNPEDFMDEEDLGEFGISTRKIHTSYKFKDPNSEAKKRKFNELDSAIPGEAPLKALIKPVRDSIGVEILKKLGWRPGQGIGPRVKKTQEANAKVYGCSLPESVSTDDDPFALSYTFAPEDTDAVVYMPKDDCFGLGYTGLSKQSVLSARFDTDNPTSTKSFLKKDKRKLAITGQAFGVGAFEDDDEDVYSKDDMSQYDFSELNPTSDHTLSKSGKSKFEKCPDGVIEGFQLASQPSALKKYYPPPDLPPDFIPKFSKLLSQCKSRTQEPHQKPFRTSSVTERSFLLGEKKFQSFSLKTPSLPVKESKQEVSVPSQELKIITSVKAFKPFPNDVMKQHRYEEFLKVKVSGELDKLVLPSSMTEWEKQQEIEEFHRASLLFKPLSGVLSSKFESRSHLSVEHEVMDAIEKAKLEKSLKSSSTVKKLVGLKNRVTFDWYPSSLLCKRFNVPNPYPNSTPSGSSTSLQSKSIFDHISPNISTGSNTSQVLPSSSQTVLPNEENLDILIDPVDKVGQPQQNTDGILKSDEKVIQGEIEKPSMDFFKDIFENSSSSEEEDIPEVDINQTKSIETAETDKRIPSSTSTEEILKTNSLVNKNLPKKSGFGVFANLDLDALNQRNFTKQDKPVVEKKQTDNGTNLALKEDKDMPCDTKTEEMQQTDLYGPALPPNYSEISVVNSLKYPSKKHKLKHKHKHHKNKSKKKKKKKSSHKSSDEYSSDSEEDINPAVILEKFKKLQKNM